jgi:cytoskeletal protein RodZ
MTCEEFERVVTDLACEFLIEAATRKRALAHACTCAGCAARFEQERALTTALNITARAETAQAPALMKTALMAAFQQQTKPAAVAAPPVPAAALPRRERRWLVAAAALMFLAILVALQVLHRQSQVESSPISGPTFAGTSSVTDKASPAESAARTNLTKKEDVQTGAPNHKTNNAVPAARRRMRPVFRPELASQARSSETMTDFIPLTTLAESTAMKSGTIVRVEMPRASLLAMGLPLNTERAHETVKADIVVGDDGLARAIRLVY